MFVVQYMQKGHQRKYSVTKRI